MNAIWIRMKKSRKFQINFFFSLVVMIVAIFAEHLVPHGPLEANLANALQEPSKDYWFGTDQMGRCLFSRVLCGAQSSLGMTFLVVAIIFILGTGFGVLAGYFGGGIDLVIMRIADIMIAFPGMILAISIAGMMGAGLYNAVFAIAAVTWPRYARLSRSLVLKIKKNVYIDAAQAMGTKPIGILIHYIIPNFISTMIVTGTMDIGVITMELAGLSFLGFGAQPPAPEWGLMLSEGKKYIQTAPWMLLYPGLAIFIVIVIFNLLGDNLRDVMDSRQEME